MSVVDGNIELARLRREAKIQATERKVLERGSDYASIFHGKVRIEDNDIFDKYVRYRLREISPTDDCELYFIVETLMYDTEWVPTDWQTIDDGNVFNEITRDIEVYSSGDNFIYNSIEIGSGEILMYFAHRLAFETGLSVAKSCEILLKNCGIYLPQHTDDFVDIYHEALDSNRVLFLDNEGEEVDENNPEGCPTVNLTSMFDVPYDDPCCQFWDWMGTSLMYDGERWRVNNWEAQFQFMLWILMGQD